MLGDVIRCQVAPKDPIVSSVFMDRVMSNWNNHSFDYGVPTLVPQENIWEEFWLSASDTRNWCPRACAIRAFAPPISSSMQQEMAWRLEIGKSYHAMFQNTIMTEAYGDDLLGAWGKTGKKPPKDSSKVDYLKDGTARIVVRPIKKKPKGEVYYIEPKIRIPGYRIVVKLDGVLNQEKIGKEVQEIKTEQDSAMDSLNIIMGGAPRKHHVEQIHLGMWASGIHKGRIIYVFKGDKTMLGSVLECEIDYDEDIIDRLKRVALSCKNAVLMCDDWKLKHDDVESEYYEDEKSKFLDSFVRYDECPMKSKGRAKSCYARDLCFVKKAKIA